MCICTYIYIYIHTCRRICTEILLSHKKDEMMPFATTWMDLKIIITSEVSQRKTNTIWYCLYVESKKMMQMNYLQNRDRFTYLENEITVTRGEEVGKNRQIGSLGWTCTHCYN